jgi:hypothetical protein
MMDEARREKATGNRGKDIRKEHLVSKSQQSKGRGNKGEKENGMGASLVSAE